MEEYNIDLHSPNRTPLSEMSSTIEIFNNLVSVESSRSNIQGIMQLANEGPNDDDRHQQSQFQDGFNTDQIPVFDLAAHIVSSGYGYDNPIMILEPEAIVNSASYPVSGNGFLPANDDNSKVYQEFQNYVGKKRKRAGEREAEKDREVVHVRAKRGQATDSHSLAERLRREKINEKLRCLQDLVPGCYKTMGLAVTLDVIINYVRSLQNQIDFLSMKLSAASLYYDFNSSDPDTMEAVQTTSNGYEAQLGMDKVVGQAYEGIFHFQSQD